MGGLWDGLGHTLFQWPCIILGRRGSLVTHSIEPSPLYMYNHNDARYTEEVERRKAEMSTKMSSNNSSHLLWHAS